MGQFRTGPARTVGRRLHTLALISVMAGQVHPAQHLPQHCSRRLQTPMERVDIVGDLGVIGRDRRGHLSGRLGMLHHLAIYRLIIVKLILNVYTSV